MPTPTITTPANGTPPPATQTPAPVTPTPIPSLSIPATFGNSTGIGMHRDGLPRGADAGDLVSDIDTSVTDPDLPGGWGDEGQATETTETSDDTAVVDTDDAVTQTQTQQQTQPKESQNAQILQQVLQGAKAQDQKALTEIATLLVKRHGATVPAAVLKQLAHQELAIRKFKGELPSVVDDGDGETEVVEAAGVPDATATDTQVLDATGTTAADQSDEEALDGIIDDLTEFERERLAAAAKPKVDAVAAKPTVPVTPPKPLSFTGADSWLPEGITAEEARDVFGHGEFGTSPEDLIRYQEALVDKIGKGEAAPSAWTAFQQKLTNRHLYSQSGQLVVETIVANALRRVGIDVEALGQEQSAAVEKRATEQAFRDLLTHKDAKGNNPYAGVRDLTATDKAKPKLKLPNGDIIANTPMNRILARHGDAIRGIQVSGRNPSETARLTATARLRHVYKLHKESVTAATAAATATTKAAVTAGKTAETTAIAKTTNDLKRALNGSGGTTTSPANDKVAKPNGAGQQPNVNYSQVLKANKPKTFQDL